MKTWQRSAKAVGAITYNLETEKGLKPDTLYCYDLELPTEFRPRCIDGEVAGFELLSIRDVMKIVADLKAAGVYDQTLIFLLTDHGISHLRGKQFLYDEGTKVPLIVKFPGDKNGGTVRTDLVKHIDILASSLAYAGIPVPESDT